MYVRYVTNAVSTYANVIADIAALLSGATIASLSANCDKAASVILANNVAPGWSLVDDAAGAGTRVVSAPDIDGLTTKYARLAMFNTHLLIETYESWNATTHVGTNLAATPSTTQGVPLSQTAINTIYILANPRCFVIAEPNGGMNGCFEFSRDMDYLKGTAYPCHCAGSGRSMAGYANASTNDTTMRIPRIKAQTTTGDSTGSAVTLYTGTIQTRVAAANTTGTPTVPLQDSNGVYYHEVRPIWALLPASLQNNCGILGVFYNIWETTRMLGNFFDILNIGPDNYMIIPNGNSVAGNTLIMKLE